MPVNADLVGMIPVLASTIEARDPCTGGVLWRVSQFSQRLARRRYAFIATQSS